MENKPRLSYRNLLINPREDSYVINFLTAVMAIMVVASFAFFIIPICNLSRKTKIKTEDFCRKNFPDRFEHCINQCPNAAEGFCHK